MGIFRLFSLCASFVVLLVNYLGLGSFSHSFEACQIRLFHLGGSIFGESVVLGVQILVEVILISHR